LYERRLTTLGIVMAQVTTYPQADGKSGSYACLHNGFRHHPTQGSTVLKYLIKKGKMLLSTESSLY